MTTEILSQEYLKEILHYNPETGLFRWNKTMNCNAVSGQRAGFADKDGYIGIMVNGRNYRAHRLAWLYMTGSFPKKYMDHINHLKCDNSWVNLREVTRSENFRNMKKSKANTSGVTGINWSEPRKKWVASICVNGVSRYLGGFNEKWDAICARKSAEAKYDYHPNHGT